MVRRCSQLYPSKSHLSRSFGLRQTPIDIFAEFLRSAAAKNDFLRCSKQTTNLASINMTQLRTTPVPLPPLVLQQHFAVFVARHERLRAGQREALRQADHLFQSLVHRAFS